MAIDTIECYADRDASCKKKIFKYLDLVVTESFQMDL
jgi:hypothetical protein